VCAALVAVGLLVAAGVPGRAGAAMQTITVYATADNGLIYSTEDDAAAQTVFANGDLAVGCFWIAGYAYDSWTCYSTALRFALPDAVVGRPIEEATLRLQGYAGAEDFLTQYRVAAFASSWSASTITFANQPQHWNAAQTYLYPPTLNPIEIDVTGIVANWADGTWANHGLLLEDSSFVFPNYTANRVTFLYSMDYYDLASHRPQLVIRYDGAPLPELTFSADPVVIAPGETSTLRWSAANTDSCTLPGQFFNLPGTGTWGVSPAVTTTYTLACTGAGGSSSQSVTVTVTQLPLLTFWAEKSVITLGESTVLTWRSTNALGCEYYRLGDLFAHTIPENGSQTVSPVQTTTYRVTCENFSGEVRREVTVAVPEPGLAASAVCAGLALGALGSACARRGRI
jgi:hypothetical protein